MGIKYFLWTPKTSGCFSHNRFITVSCWIGIDKFEHEVQSPYLLYCNAAQKVNGIWFYNSRECEDVANLFSRQMPRACNLGDDIMSNSPTVDLEIAIGEI